MPDREWKKDDFTKMVSEGKGSFDSAWKELKDAGYLKVYITSYGKGTKREYELLDEPKDGPSEIYIKKESMDESPESIENTEFVQLPENQVPGNQEPGNQVLGNQESGIYINTKDIGLKEISKDLNNNTFNNNHLLPPSIFLITRSSDLLFFRYPTSPENTFLVHFP